MAEDDAIDEGFGEGSAFELAGGFEDEEVGAHGESAGEAADDVEGRLG